MSDGWITHQPRPERQPRWAIVLPICVVVGGLVGLLIGVMLGRVL